MLANEKTRLLREVWKKAMRDGELRMDFKDSRTAYRVRMALYNSANAKACNEDYELLEARENCSVQIVSPICIAVVRADKAQDTQIIAGFLGEGVSSLTAAQKMEKESAARVLQRVREMGPLPQVAAVPIRQGKKFLDSPLGEDGKPKFITEEEELREAREAGDALGDFYGREP